MFFKMYSAWWNAVLVYVYFTTRPLIKWFLRRFTRLCELQRICYGATNARRALLVENSLNWSRTEIRDLVPILDGMVEKNGATMTAEEFHGEITEVAVNTVMRVKRIKKAVHPDFPRLLETCVEQIWGYKKLNVLVEAMRTTMYNDENATHERKLLELWDLLMPDTKLESRVTKQWQDIGFQGDDPKTDFRGMGVLGLDNLIYFAREYTEPARHVLSHSLHPVHGYTFAIVGINLTSMAYNLLKSGQAKSHIFNASPTDACLYHFHQFYCYLFLEFDRFWMKSKPKSIMDFSFIQRQFEEKICKMLTKDTALCQINFSIDNV